MKKQEDLVDMHRISNIAKEMIYSEIELKFENWKDNLQQMIDQKLQVDNMRVFPLNNDDPLPPQQTFSKDLPAYQTAEPQINYIESAKFINTPQINGSQVESMRAIQPTGMYDAYQK